MSTKSDISPIQSVLGGAAAGGIESGVTYPTEYVKTRQQLLRKTTQAAASPLSILSSTVKEYGISRLYTGGTAFCISNAAKSGVRFLTFDLVRKHMPKGANGKTSVTSNLASGVAAGVAESFTVLAPGETIKTKMIQGGGGIGQPQMSSRVMMSIYRVDGLVGFYRGVWPVTFKQSANAMVRFSSYNFLLERVQPALSSYGVGGSATAIAGAIAGILTVYCTMPFDNIKTQLQRVEAKQMYTGSWDCGRKLVLDEGVKRLWKGTTPRLFRLSVSGAISFTVYEEVVTITSRLMREAGNDEQEMAA